MHTQIQDYSYSTANRGKRSKSTTPQISADISSREGIRSLENLREGIRIYYYDYCKSCTITRQERGKLLFD
jgi:hypothetical protein